MELPIPGNGASEERIERRYRRLRSQTTTVRADTRAVLNDWGLSPLSEPVVAVVQELVTNGLDARHPGRGRTLLVTWRYLPAARVRVEVHDTGRGAPRPTPNPDPDSERGRGLAIVAALSDSWGWHREVIGKTVWAEFSVPDAAPPGAGLLTIPPSTERCGAQDG
jgi:anti-sigma regulatory factor (Ser/Thr protein kinase)